MDTAVNKTRQTAGNENTSLIKLFAFVTMFIDHMGAAIFPRVTILRYIGRVAFPLFCWCMVVGVCKSRHVYRYALRVFLCGLISQPFYMLALNHEITELNIFFTLLCGMLAIIGIREKKYYSHLWAPMIALMISHFVKMDYGTLGVLLLILLYLFRKSPLGIAGVMIFICLFWWQGNAMIKSLQMLLTDYRTIPIVYVSKIQPYAIFALPLMLLPLSSSFQLPKWFSYSFYSLHLMVIYLLDRFVL